MDPVGRMRGRWQAAMGQGEGEERNDAHRVVDTARAARTAVRVGGRLQAGRTDRHDDKPDADSHAQMVPVVHWRGRTAGWARADRAEPASYASRADAAGGRGMRDHDGWRHRNDAGGGRRWTGDVPAGGRAAPGVGGVRALAPYASAGKVMELVVFHTWRCGLLGF